ncbi:uncharacterized protein LOC135351979 isoform X2 [Halichondria panicea]|uniref:uncharacterized protein LOC135351979 isoform X2 n=1 Tax=Halichondria panicea TaxID=6063 RepID=UPI00312BA6F4
MMVLVTKSMIVVLLCGTLSQCSAAGTVSFCSGSESQIVMEGGSLSVCVEAILDPGDSVEVGLSVTPAGELDVPANTLHLNDTTTIDCWMVTATDNDIYETDSQILTLNLVLVNPTPSDIVLTDPSTATITEMDDEVVMVKFTTSAGENIEGVILVAEGQSVEVCVSVSGATISEREVVVQVATSELQDDPKAATSNMDYKHVTKDATLTSNESQVCMIIIRARIDLIYENNEVFGVNLSIDASANLRVRLGAQKTVCIRDGDRAVVSLVNTIIMQNEGDGDVSVCARLDSPVGGTEKEIFITLNSIDFTFPANSSVEDTQCLTIKVTIDNVYQRSPVLMQTVTLSKMDDQERLYLTNTVTMVTINDDDDAVISMVNDTVTTTEGGVAYVCANLVSPSGGTSVPITVVFVWSGANSNPNTEVCMQLTVADDDIYGTSPVAVMISNFNSRVSVGTRNQTIITVRDDDDVTIEMKNETLDQNEGDGGVTVCAILTGPPGGLEQSVTVQFTAPANLSPNGQQTLTFPSGATERCITYTDPVNDDELFETTSPLASFIVTLSDNQDRVTATGITIINVYDDDDAVVSIVTPTMTTIEGGVVAVCANLDSPSGGTSVPITVVFTWSGGSDSSIFSANSNANTRACIWLTVADDDIYGTSPIPVTVVLNISSPISRVSVGNIGQTIITVRDDDDAVVSMVNDTMTTTEGGVANVCANLVSPSGGTSVPITVVFVWSGGGLDSAIFSANSNTRACIQLTVADDDIYGTSPIPVYTVMIRNFNLRVTIGTISQTIITVRDDDDVTIEIKNETLNQNEEDGDVTVCAILTGPPGGLRQSVTVQFTAPATVLILNGKQTNDVTFPSGAKFFSEQCITYTDPVRDDELFETTSPLASFTVTLSDNQDCVTATGTTTINVYDDDNPVLALSQLSYTFAEATKETGEICVMFEGPSGGLATGTLEVLFTIDTGNINRPATPQVDFTTSSLMQTRQFLTIGESRCISVTIVDDVTADPGELFRVLLTSPNNRITFRGGAVAIVIIDNDDVLPGPTNLRNSTTEPKSVILMWDPPDTTSITVALIGYSVQVTGTSGFPSMSHTTNSSFIVINNLFPYQQYQFSVSAIYEEDNIGEIVSIVVRTRQEAPGILTAPTATSTATTLTLSWDPPAEPNGVIITYTLYVDYLNGTITNIPTPSASFLLSPLSPYQTISVQVSASTSVGEGPRTNSTRFTTAEAKSGPVGDLNVLRVNKTTFTVNWVAPAEVNGVLLTYTIRTNEEGSSSADTEYNTLATLFTIHELAPYTPYVVSVAAINGAGIGEPVSVVEFTAEGVPLIHPRDIGSTRLNGTAVRVSWRPLSRSEARGFITNYTITYWRVGSNTANAITITVSGEDASSATIINLDPNSDYYFTVSAGTVQGVSNVSAAIVIPTQSSGNQPMVGVGGIAAGLIMVVVLLTIIVCIVCIVRRRQHSEFAPKQKLMKHAPPPKPIRSPDTYPLHGKDIESQGELHKEEVEVEVEVDTAFYNSEDIAVTDFAGHVRELHKDDDTDFESEYRSIKNGNHSWNVAQLPENKFKKNRFTNIFPYDHCRVKLQSTDVPGSDYINASWIKGYRNDNAYVAAQGPMAATINDFWRMIWENKLPTIVMVTKLVESSREKCARYWPSATGEKMEVGPNIFILLKEIKLFTDYEIRIMSITNASELGSSPFLVTHFYYLGWPDHGVPQYATSLLGYLRRVRKTHPVSGPPLLVHCSAGVGRTGTFIVLDAMLQRIQEERVVNVYQFVWELRERRCLMVQTKSQYMFIHDALDELITCGNTEIAAHNLNIATHHLGTIAPGKSLSGYEEQFQLLEQVSRKPSQQDRDIIASQEVESKNRYHDKFPYDVHRPKLMGSSKQDQYINASFIDGYKHRRCFVVTQAPLDNTVLDFWKMAKNLGSRTIVLLCDLTENGKDMCTQYWPDKVDGEVTYGKITIKLLSEKCEKEIVVRKLEISQTMKVTGRDCYVLTMFHCMTWNENGTPPAPEPVIHLNELVVNNQKSTGNKPITVMCNDGCGRSGTFLSVYSTIDRFKVEAVVDVFQCVKSARIQRMALMANTKQYILVHEVLKNYMNSFDQYAIFTVQ